jgi:ABC-2 type transport system permease protein
MMPVFFLSGALFPLSGLPGWLTVLTRIDPASYGVDAMRRIVLSQAGVPADTVEQFGLSLLGQPLNGWADIGLVAIFATLMIALAVIAFSVQD